MRGLITRNFQLKVLAALVSIIAWSGVVYAGNPPETRALQIHVPQETSAIPLQFVLVHPIADLSVSISGTRDHVDAFDPSVLKTSVDFKDISHGGVQQIPVTIVNPDTTVQLENAPSTVEVDLDQLSSAVLPVKIELKPPPPPGYIAPSSSATPATVTVVGPQHELKGLVARVTLDLSQQKTNLAEDAPVLLIDPTGAQLNNLSVTPQIVQVNVSVQTTVTSRSSAVVPSITGTLPAGYQLIGITVDPQTTLLAGPREILNILDSVPTASLSLTGLTHDITVTVAISPPAGVGATPSTATVTLHIVSIAPTPTQTPVPTPTPPPTPSPSGH